MDENIIEEIIRYAKSSAPADKGSAVRYSGEQTLLQRRKSESEGIEVNEQVWEEIQKM